MGSHSVVLPSSRWLMSVVDSLDDRCSPECPGAMRRLGAMRSLSSPARCRASFLSACRRSCRGSSLNGGVSYKACRHETSPCPVVGEIPVCPGCISSGSSRLKRPSVCSVRSCRSMACWNKTKVHVAGVPLSSVEADCRLRRSFRLRRWV